MHNVIGGLIAFGIVAAVALLYCLLAIPMRLIFWALGKAFWLALGWGLVIYAIPRLFDRLADLLTG